MAKPKVQTDVDEVVGRIRVARAELMRLRTELIRCTSAASVGAEHSAALEMLREQRHQVLAEAYADGSPPDTSEIDQAINRHELAHADAIRSATLARDAATVIQARIEAQKDLMEPLRGEWCGQAQQILLEALDTAEEHFGRALEGLAVPVAELTAIASMYKLIMGKPLPADGRDNMVEGLRGVAALRVRWDFSPLKHPAVSAHFAPESYQGAARFVARWLDPALPDFAARELADLRTMLRVDDVQA